MASSGQLVSQALNSPALSPDSAAVPETLSRRTSTPFDHPALHRSSTSTAIQSDPSRVSHSSHIVSPHRRPASLSTAPSEPTLFVTSSSSSLLSPPPPAASHVGRKESHELQHSCSPSSTLDRAAIGGTNSGIARSPGSTLDRGGFGALGGVVTTHQHVPQMLQRAADPHQPPVAMQHTHHGLSPLTQDFVGSVRRRPQGVALDDKRRACGRPTTLVMEPDGRMVRRTTPELLWKKRKEMRVLLTQPRKTAYRKFLDWMKKYRRVMIALHFLFIAFNCAVVAPTCAVVNLSEAYAQAGVTQTSIQVALYLAALSLPVWIYATVCACFKRAQKFSAERWLGWGVDRRGVFWMWLVSNICQGIMWTVVTVVYWNPNWICTAKGEGADIYPYKSTCDEVANIWCYALFNAGAIYLNVVFIVDDETNDSVNDCRREVEHEIAEALREWDEEVLGEVEDEGVEVGHHGVLVFHGARADADGWAGDGGGEKVEMGIWGVSGSCEGR
ncbi:hypothetical protein HK101_000985 [Irineochytrium annulatum]|nr:hypothetical protein HK101_000985 [Irineochytrium annulatum]